MSGAAQPQPARATVAGRLRLLADLVNEALVEMGTRPAFAGPMLVRQAATETQSAARKAGRLGGRSSRALQPVPDPQDPKSGGVDAEHAETWQLVHLAQGGDGEAFGQLYDRYVDTVFRFIYFRVNDRALAEDFTSETFLRALRRIGTISYQGRDIGAWFITIARNIVLDHMKSARHRLEVTTADTVEGSLSGHDQSPSTENAVLDTLASERLMEAVAQLGAEQRECVTLRFIQGLSVSETAAVMGKNDGAIKALQHRAVRKLADLIGNDLR